MKMNSSFSRVLVSVLIGSGLVLASGASHANGPDARIFGILVVVLLGLLIALLSGSLVGAVVGAGIGCLAKSGWRCVICGWIGATLGAFVGTIIGGLLMVEALNLQQRTPTPALPPIKLVIIWVGLGLVIGVPLGLLAWGLKSIFVKLRSKD